MPARFKTDDAAIERRFNLFVQGTCGDNLLASSGVRMIRLSFLSVAVAILMSFCLVRQLTLPGGRSSWSKP